MDNLNTRKVWRLRAHHICCLPFGSFPSVERGKDYEQVLAGIMNALLEEPEAMIRVVEGVDDLCQPCPLRSDRRCTSPMGNEEQVRKWDQALLRDLGVTFDTCMTSREWRDIVKQKVPFRCCPKCPWQKSCTQGFR